MWWTAPDWLASTPALSNTWLTRRCTGNTATAGVTCVHTIPRHSKAQHSTAHHEPTNLLLAQLSLVADVLEL